eukprot:1235354-Rhodomonas_salina.3
MQRRASRAGVQVASVRAAQKQLLVVARRISKPGIAWHTRVRNTRCGMMIPWLRASRCGQRSKREA